MVGSTGLWGSKMTSLRMVSAGSTHEGKVRERNEDAFLADPDRGIWAVADGMGGHEHGELASAEIVEALTNCDVDTGFEEACARFSNAIHAANASIHEAATGLGVQMGSTVVALLAKDNRFAIFWVGDSRAYLLRGGAMYQVSTDHTQVQEMVERGIITPEQAHSHPMSHALARAVGALAEVQVDAIQDEIVSGDIFLLCSDGLHGYVDESAISDALRNAPPDRVADILVEKALAVGAPDNVTVVSVKFSEPTLLSFAKEASLA